MSEVEDMRICDFCKEKGAAHTVVLKKICFGEYEVERDICWPCNDELIDIDLSKPIEGKEIASEINWEAL